MLNLTCRTVLKSEIQARQGSTKILGEIERLFIEVQIFGSNAVLRSIYDFKKGIRNFYS